MSQTMKIKKGDRVHVLRGKDAGKEGRVVEALPKDGKIIVETKPLSKTKNWRLAEILEVAK